MAESVRNLSGFFFCERLNCSLFPEACGKRSRAAGEGDLRMLPCLGCPIGEAHAEEFGFTQRKKPPRFLLDIAKGRGAEAEERRRNAKTGNGPRTYPEQVKQAKQILARIDARRAK